MCKNANVLERHWCRPGWEPVGNSAWTEVQTLLGTWILLAKRVQTERVRDIDVANFLNHLPEDMTEDVRPGTMGQRDPTAGVMIFSSFEQDVESPPGTSRGG